MSEGLSEGDLVAERYRIVRLIGLGAMGRVYEAEHTLMRKRVALKLLHESLSRVPEMVGRFEREAMAAARITHPHVASAMDFGKLPDGTHYLALEFVDGQSLAAILADQGALHPSRALSIAAQVTEALVAAHRAGIVHRDLKPENILITKRDDQSDFVKVLDFGVARFVSGEGAESLTQGGLVYGTPEYMAPEQALGQEIDPRADLFSVGVLLFEMLTGRRPWTGPESGLLGQQLSGPPPHLSADDLREPAEKAIDATLQRLLSKDREERIATADELHAVLVRLMSRQLSISARHSRGERVSVDAVPRQEMKTVMELPTPSVAPSAHADASPSDSPRPVSRTTAGSRAAPPGRSRWLMPLLAALLATGAAVSAFIVVEQSDELSETVVETSEAQEAPVQEVDVDELLKNARVEGSEALGKVAEAYPESPDAIAEWALALANEKKYKEAFDVAQRALEMHPALNADQRLKGTLFRTAQNKSSANDTYRLLKTAMGEEGVVILFDLSRSPRVTKTYKKGAAAWLRKDEVWSRAPSHVKIAAALDKEVKQPHALDRVSRKECPGVVERLRAAAVEGDDRSLAPLRIMKRALEGGSLVLDCIEIAEVQAAISAIEKREKEEAEKRLGL